MRLVIEQTEQYDENFIEWLIPIIKFELLSEVKYVKFIKFNNYIRENAIFDSYIQSSNATMHIINAIKLGINSLKYDFVRGHYVIDIDSTKVLPGCKMKVKQLCKFINYGNSDLKGYPLFDKIFKKVESNLQDYYSMYLVDKM